MIAAQASLEIDALAPEGREPGSDLAIGHGGHCMDAGAQRTSRTSSVS